MNLLSQLTIVLTLSHFAVSLWLSLLDEVKDVFFSELDEFYQEFGQPVNTSDVRFYLYTSDDDESTDNLIDTTNPAKLSQAKDKVYFLIHGWLGGRESCPWYRPLTKILLEKSPHAFVIQVDWSEPASQFYGHAVFSTESVVAVLDLLPSVNDPSGYINDPSNLALDEQTEVTGHSVNISDVRFYLYTSKDSETTNHFIDPNHPTKLIQAKNKIYFLIHGWLQSPETTPWFSPLTELLLKKLPESYIVQTDWSKYTGGNYSSAAYASEGVGKTMGNFIYKLVKDFQVPSKNIVLIGHSLGGQIAGLIGKTYFEKSRSKLPRFIALDPSGPIFKTFPIEKKLNKNDAKVVMVVHTDKTKLGYPHKCGSIDFFPNGGTNQPGCSSTNDTNLCSHNLAYKLFIEAVQFPQFYMAKKCLNYHDFKTGKCGNEEVSLGDLETSQTGNFYLVTSDKAPYFIIHEE